MPVSAIKFEDSSELEPIFANLNFSKVRSINLSGNSYAIAACKWLAENVVSKMTNLSIVNFSDMFTSRLKTEIPLAMVNLMDALMDKEIRLLNVRDNAFGPIGVESLSKFLSKCATLKSLNVSNCGLGPKGSSMIAEYLMANEMLMLTEFYACRSKLEQDGMNAMSEVFLKQKCLQVIDVNQNGSKMGLRKLFEALTECKDLRHVNVNDNHINKAIPQLTSFLQNNTANLEYLNISNLNMKKKNCKIISEVIIESIKNSKLKELAWDYDLNCSTSTAQTFL
jgi:Ran GTPase-activating protein 1